MAPDVLWLEGIAMDSVRWANIVTLDREYSSGAARLAGRPLEAYIEVAARCNLRCQMCAITVDPRYDPHSGLPPLLGSDLFDRLEPLFPTLRRVYLQGLGEPLLNRNLVDYTRRLAAAGVEVWTTTNATLVRTEQADALARAGLTRITVSIDGATAETYERIRKRGRFSDVIRGLRALGAARRLHGRPRLVLSMVAMASNLHELPALVELCAEIGGDGVYVEELYEWAALAEVNRRESLELLGAARVEELLAAGRRRAEELGLEWSSRMDEKRRFGTAAKPAGRGTGSAPHDPGPAAGGQLVATAAVPAAPATSDQQAGAGLLPAALPWPCSEPWATINVNASGEVRTCCFNNEVLGRLTEQPIEAIWNSDAYRELRSEQASLRTPASCSQCVLGGRMKRSPHLSLRSDPAAVPDRSGQARLLAPAAGELVGDPLILFGRLPLLKSLPPRACLPEVHLDGTLLARLADFALVTGSRFAALIPIPFVTEGTHSLSLVPAGGGPAWDARPLQIGAPDPPWTPGNLTGNLSGADGGGGRQADEIMAATPLPELIAMTRLALLIRLDRTERRPALRIGGRAHPIAGWLCAQDSEGWLGVAVLEVARLRPGRYDLDARFRHQPPRRWRLIKLAESGVTQERR